MPAYRMPDGRTAAHRRRRDAPHLAESRCRGARRMHRRRPRDHALARPGSAAVSRRRTRWPTSAASARAPSPSPTRRPAACSARSACGSARRGDVGEIGYWLRADARGRGTITRALRVVSRVGVRHAGTSSGCSCAPTSRTSRRGAPPRRRASQLEGVLRSVYWNARLGAGRTGRCTRCCRTSSRAVSATGTGARLRFRAARRSRRTRARAPRRCRSSR